MKKLKSKAGFTLVEVLVSLVIITMSIALFSGMIHATHAVVNNQSDYRVDMAKQYETLDNKLAQVNLSSMSATSTEPKMAITVTNVSKTPAKTIIDVDRLKNNVTGNVITKSATASSINLGKFTNILGVNIYSSESSATTSSVPAIYAYKFNPNIKAN